MTDETQVLTIQDMINAVKADSPSGFDAAFNDTIGARIAAALDAKRDEVAQNYFEPQQQDQQTETDEVDLEAEDDNEDTETDSGSDEETSTDDKG